MPNTFAWVALAAWLPITLLMFSRLRASIAASISIFGGVAFLPNGISFDLPLMPPLDRESISVLSSLLGCLLFTPAVLRGRTLGSGVEALGLVMILGGVGTALTNGDPVRYGVKFLPPLSLWDIVALSAETILAIWLPFYLGRCLVREPKHLIRVLAVLAMGGVVYSVLVLWEVRMSPRLHLMLYGYNPAPFGMAKRGGLWGWRPMVFVGHGINLTMLLLACTLAAAALWRARARVLPVDIRAGVPYLYAVLFACQSLGSFLYGTFALPMLIFLRSTLQSRVLLALAIVVLTYPVTRALDLFPTDELVDLAELQNPDRAASLDFRFYNESLLIERANERALFGWGGFGRNRLYDEASGEKGVVTDGYWVIVLGQRGAIGFLCVFGFLLIPVALAARVLWRVRANTRESFLIAATAWICAFSAVDLLPNASITVGTLFLSGALLGAVESWPIRGEGRKLSEEDTPAVLRASPVGFS